MVKAAAGVGAIAGHSWPVFLRFKGGRGVATGMGAMAVMLPLVVVLAVLVALPLIMMSRYMSLGSLIGAVLVGVVTLGEVLLNDQPWAYFCYAALGSGLIVIKHRDNIERILSGTERRL
ncbi:MAG: glycerol-3-phosphate acyltransferase [Chloroflexia bacterium]